MVTGDYYYDDTVQLRVKRLCMVAVGAKKEGEGGERGGRREKNSKEREGGKGRNTYTVEQGHYGAKDFVLCREVVPMSEVK